MIQITERPDREAVSVAMQRFVYGENTSVPPGMLNENELSSCINFKMRRGGRLETRESIQPITDSDTDGGIVDICRVTLADAVARTLVTDSAGKVYYLKDTTTTAGVTTTDPVRIDADRTVGAASSMIAYNNVALICDSGYLKYVDDIAGDIHLAYDAGNGGTFFDNYTGEDDGSITITSSGVGCTFTTPAWDAGYTIPPTSVWFKGLQNTGGAATVEVSIYDISASAQIAATSYTLDFPTSAADYLEVAFDDASVTGELRPSKSYRCLLKGSNFDLSYTDTTSGSMVTGGATLDPAKQPIMRVHPGLPPKADFGTVSGNRIFVHSPDEPGRVYFGNLTYLDWSTPAGGGWIGVVDDAASSFAVGGMADLYGTLFVYGTEDQPFLCRLTGDTPEEWALPLMFQRAWTTHRTLLNTTNDLWAGSGSGVDPLAGVQEFGDLRTFSVSDPISDRILNYWDSSTAFAGYNARDGQYWLWMPGFDYVSVCHTKIPVPVEGTGETRYPWTRYTLPITPTCFVQAGQDFMIGGSDGFIYRLDPDYYKDLGTDKIEAQFRTSQVNLPFRKSDIVQIHTLGTSRSGSQFDINLYRDGNLTTPVVTWVRTFPIQDGITIDALTMDIDDMLFAISPDQSPMYFHVNVTVRSFLFEFENIFIAGLPVYFDGLILEIKRLKH